MLRFITVLFICGANFVLRKYCVKIVFLLLLSFRLCKLYSIVDWLYNIQRLLYHYDIIVTVN